MKEGDMINRFSGSNTAIVAAQNWYAVTGRSAITAYVIYAVIALVLIIYLARTLHRSGAVFLRDVFESDELAEAINHLLVVGFLLLNLGYAIVLYRVTPDYDSEISFINDLVQRLGILVLSLGVVHLVNMFVFWKIRNHDKSASSFPPAAAAYLPVPPVVNAGVTPPPPVAF
ncbi:MAG: hypothetical protein R2706_01305 [Acidimicrobiales bacterium]